MFRRGVHPSDDWIRSRRSAIFERLWRVREPEQRWVRSSRGGRRWIRSSRGDGWVWSANVERVWSTHEPGRIRTARQSGRFWTTAVTDGGRLRRRERLRTIVRVWTVRWWVRTVRWWVWTIGRGVRAVERVRAVWWRWVRTAVWFRTTAVTAVAERIQRVRSRVHSNETIGKRLMKSIDINTHSNF